MNAIKERKIVYTSGQIAERVRAMAAEIDAFYGDEPLVAVCVLKGAVFFFTDLVRAMRSENLELDFVRLSSYGKGTSSSRHVVFSKDVDCDITGKHVLIVEDVVDSAACVWPRWWTRTNAAKWTCASILRASSSRKGSSSATALTMLKNIGPCLMWKSWSSNPPGTSTCPHLEPNDGNSMPSLRQPFQPAGTSCPAGCEIALLRMQDGLCPAIA